MLRHMGLMEHAAKIEAATLSVRSFPSCLSLSLSPWTPANPQRMIDHRGGQVYHGRPRGQGEHEPIRRADHAQALSAGWGTGGRKNRLPKTFFMVASARPDAQTLSSRTGWVWRELQLHARCAFRSKCSIVPAPTFPLFDSVPVQAHRACVVSNLLRL